MKGIILLLAFVSTACNAQIVPIKHPYPAIDPLSLYTITSIYTLRKQFWPDGTRITVYYTESKLREFCHENLFVGYIHCSNKIKSNFKDGKYYIKLNTDFDVIEKVSNTHGSVGYVYKSSLRKSDKVEVLQVEKGD